MIAIAKEPLYSGTLRTTVTFLILGLCLLLSPWTALAEVGNMVVVNGQVSILRGGQLPAVTATVGTEVNVGDFVRTKSSSGCEIRFRDGNVIKVGPRSRIDISEYAVDRDTRSIGLSRGKVEAVVVPPLQKDTKLQPKRFEIHTPNAVAGVRGTDYLVFYEGNATGVLVISLHDGDTVYAYSLLTPEQLVDLPAGFITYIRGNQSPTNPRQATDAEISALLRELLALMGSEDPWYLLAVDDVNQEGNFEYVPVSDTFPELLQAAYEVGQINLSGNNFEFSIDNMTVRFLSATEGSSPSMWLSTDINGSWATEGAYNLTDSTAFLSSPDTAGGYGSASFTITEWDTTTGRWTADIIGNASNVTQNGNYIDFSGTGAGSGVVDYWTGTFTGTAGGTATSQPEAYIITGQ